MHSLLRASLARFYPVQSRPPFKVTALLNAPVDHSGLGFVGHFHANNFRPPVSLILFPREHTHAHPLCVSIDARDSSLTLALQGSDKRLRASFENGSNQRKLLGAET